MTKHTIDTGEATPIKVPPRQISFRYADRVHAQLQDMAMEGIIRPSTSPWCAPAMYVPKSTGEVRICVDFVKLNRVTKKTPALSHDRMDLNSNWLERKCS